MHRSHVSLMLVGCLLVAAAVLAARAMGLPLAIRPQRSAKARGFVIGLFIILAYYLLQLGSDALVEMGRLTPLVGAGGTTLLFFIAAVWLFWRSARDKEVISLNMNRRKG